MAPKVYFTDFCTGTSETLPQKLSRLILSAGIDQIDFQDKFVAIIIIRRHRQCEAYCR